MYHTVIIVAYDSDDHNHVPYYCDKFIVFDSDDHNHCTIALRGMYIVVSSVLG